MGFHKVDAEKEIKKAVDKNPELSIFIRQAEMQYQLIKKIAEYRKSKGITQKEVAKRSGLTQQMVSRMEKIENSPTLDNFLRYVLALGLELSVDKKDGLVKGEDEQAAAICIG